MAKRTPEEINAIKYAVQPLTPEEGAALKARWSDEAVPPEVEAEKPAITGVSEDALKAKALELGIPVGSLSTEQIEEVKASLPERPPRAKSAKR